MTIPQVDATSYQHLMELLYEDCEDPAIQRERCPFAFRGLNQATYGLETTLMRLGNIHLETDLLRNFKKYAYRDLHEDIANDIYWLSVAQHHGLPTRLLDWTYSPLVALHFAVSNQGHFNKAGAIWKVNFKQVHGLLPDDFRETFLDKSTAVPGVYRIVKTIADLHTLDHDYIDPVIALFFEPPSLDDRIVNQAAMFSILSSQNARFDAWLESHLSEYPDIVRKIIIPASLKWEVRDRLDQANITERVMFPGLDGLCTWLKRYYGPKSP